MSSQGWGGSPSSVSPPQPQAYNSKNGPAASTYNSFNATNPNSPDVPNYDPGKGGKTVVNTEALDTFSTNLNALIKVAQSAHDMVKGMKPVAAGAFDKAWTIQDNVTGDPSTTAAASATAMQPAFADALVDLANGLTDLQDATKKMSKTYTTADELNGMKVSDLQQDLDTASTDFGGMVGGSSGAGSGG